MKKIMLEEIQMDEFESFISGIFKKELENLPKGIQIDNQELYGTRKEVAKSLRISLPTLHELTKSGILLGYRLQGRVLYKWAEVDKALSRIETVKYSR